MIQTQFQVGIKKNRDDSREQDSLYGNEIEANRETNSGACTNTMDIDINSGTCTNTMDMDINSESGPGRADKSVDFNNQTDSAI